MSKYTFTCEKDHAPVTFEVAAASDDAAMGMMLEKVKPHIAELHAQPGMPTDDQIKQVIMGGWKKA